MLKVNPEERLSITELVNQLQEIAAARNVNPKSPVTEVGVFGRGGRTSYSPRPQSDRTAESALVTFRLLTNGRKAVFLGCTVTVEAKDFSPTHKLANSGQSDLRH